MNPNPFLRTKLLAGVALLSTAIAGCSQAAPPKQAENAPVKNQWTLRDDFRHEWKNELVTYPVDAATAADKNLALIGPNDTPLPYQILREGDGNKIAFLVDVPADGQSTYRLVAGAPQTQTDIKVEETAETIRLYNSKTGVSIRKQLAEGQAPIAGIRLLSGSWAGDSARMSTPALQNYEAKVAERGPVFTEVLCEANFAGDKNWRMRFRIMKDEPVVVVSEASSVGKGASWRLRLDNGFEPTHLLRRNPLKQTTYTQPLDKKDGKVSDLQPWLRWWEVNAGTWLSLYNEGRDDMLSLGMFNPSQWVDIEKRREKIPQSKPEVSVLYAGGVLQANFDLTGGIRHWLIAALDKNESLKELDGKNNVRGLTPPAHKYVIKYGDFPLNAVKDYVLHWKSDAEHPRMIVNAQDVARFRKTYQPTAAEIAKFQKPNKNYNAVNAMPIYLASGDEKIGRNLAKAVLGEMQDQIDKFLLQEPKGSLGAWPHKQSGIQTALNLVDGAWSAFTPEERERVKAQAALIGYTVNRPDYWSTARGFNANPNMTTMVAGYNAGAGYLLADHPQSEKWIEAGGDEAAQQLNNWSDDEGGWKEAPHYAQTSYDHILGVALMARAKDGGAMLFSDKMKKVATFFAKISTPPDAGVGGIRHAPRAGNTWLDEPSGIYGILAGVWRDKDPQFASEMQWMYKQQGEWEDNGIGGAFPSLYGFREILLDPTVEAKKPDYQSTLFPKTGVSLRNGVDDRETQLYMIAGPHHEHYDNDSGSVTIWGKGRNIANDFGYGYADSPKPELHNMITSKGRKGQMWTSVFRGSPTFDYVRGISGEWNRQIAFVKDADMNAPNYFVLRDSVSTPAAATWRLWLNGEVNIADPKGNGNGAQIQAVQVAGKEDVDTDIVFVTNGGVALKTENKQYQAFGFGPNQKVGRDQEIDLNGLIASLKAGQDALTVIYPRLKTQQPPKVTILSEGRAVKIEHEAGTDYVFLNQTPFTFDEGDLHFEGVSGLVKIRGDKVAVELGEVGKLSYRGQTAKP